MTELFSGEGFRITKDKAPLPDGRVKETARVHRSDTANVLAFIDDDHILLLREFRPYYGAWIWMLPSGHIDKEIDVAAGAQRELQEETGYRANALTHLWSVNYSESIDTTNHIFLAKDLSPAPLAQDPDELMEVHTVTLEDALAKVQTSPKVHMASAYALLRYMKENTIK